MTGASGPSRSIVLKGSTDTVSEFFQYALSSVLYQRGVYPAEDFEATKKYGITVMTVKDLKLQVYLKDVLKHFTDWLHTGTLQKAVLVIMSASTSEVLERWSFDIQTNKDAIAGGGNIEERDPSIVMKEVQAIIRQITASVTFLPLLNETCTIDLLAYTDKDLPVPLEWEESDPRIIKDGANVKLRSFATSVHSVDALVSFKQTE
jgi:mitotic spindle assembly checkpoint protein MAD2